MSHSSLGIASRADSEANQKFLTLLPQIRKVISYALRMAPSHSRDEDLAECIANTYCAFARLVERGKVDLAYPTVLARFALRQLREGRRVGSRRNSQDIMSRHARRRHGIRIHQFSQESGNANWQELVVEDEHAGPADVAALRVDFRAWLRRLLPIKRRIATILAAGARTAETARRFGVSNARISQMRREFQQDWNDFQQLAPPGHVGTYR